MSLSRVARTLLVVSLFAAPLTARPSETSPHYQVVATLPNVVNGQPLRTLVFDREARRLYAGSQFGLYFADLTTADPQMQGPLVKKFITKIEVAPDLGRVFYAAVDEIGYVDAKGGPPVKISGGNASDLVYEPTKHEIYVAFGRSSSVLVFDARTGRPSATVSLPGWNASELESIPGKVFMFVGGKDGIYAIDAATHHAAAWPVDGNLVTPGTLEADPGGHYLFLARNQEVDAIDITTGKQIGRVTMFGTASVGFDPGTGLLVATWHDVTDADTKERVVSFRPSPGGLTKVEDIKNPETGRVGVEPTNHGFIQSAYHGLLVWSSEPAPPSAK